MQVVCLEVVCADGLCMQKSTRSLLSADRLRSLSGRPRTDQLPPNARAGHHERRVGNLAYCGYIHSDHPAAVRGADAPDRGVRLHYFQQRHVCNWSSLPSVSNSSVTLLA